MDDFLKKQLSIKKKTLQVVGVIILIGVPAFLLGVIVSPQTSTDTILVSLLGDENTLKPEGVNFSPVWKAWNVINEKHVPAGTSTVKTSDEKIWGIIRGLADSLDDPYTVFLPPVEAEIFNADIRGNFEGVGMEIGIRNNTLTVIAPLRGTPAERAGIKSGDSILRIDGKGTDSITIDEAVSIIRGERGTPVVFTVARDGESELLEIEVIRDVIAIPTITSELREDGVFVIELFNFSGTSPNLFRGALREFVLSDTDKLIIDLRGNPGGFLEAAVDMASWFLPTGAVVLKEDFGEGSKPKIHRSRGYDIFNEQLKMVILIDRGSASASEILAGALKEHNIATLVGDTSFGKGSVQELVQITETTSLKVTIARWLTPQGTSISQGGLTPDFIIEVTGEHIEADLDPQLEKAVQLLLDS